MQDALDLERATSAYPAAELGNARVRWVSDRIHWVAAHGGEASAAKARRLAQYAVRFRPERNNAIRMLRLRPVGYALHNHGQRLQTH